MKLIFEHGHILRMSFDEKSYAQEMLNDSSFWRQDKYFEIQGFEKSIDLEHFRIDWNAYTKFKT